MMDWYISTLHYVRDLLIICFKAMLYNVYDPTHDSLFPKEDVHHRDVFLPGVVLVVVPGLDQNNELFLRK